MKKYDVAAYIWPAYTGDEPRSRMFWPDGMGEWQTVRDARKKFPGHNWPRSPLWGYVNEADPYVMEMQIEAATDHAVNVFIYDWYWYDDRPFLEQCLNNGFLKAKNNAKMRFYLMWANHDALNLWDKRISSDQSNIIWNGAVSPEIFRRAMGRVIDNYFGLPNYYTIDSKPVFMVYDVANLVRGLGGVDSARRELDWMRERCLSAGLPGLHLQMTMWSESALNLSGLDGARDLPPYGVISALGFDSITHYQFVHFADIDRDYAAILEDVRREWRQIDARCPVPYFPHVSVGWDNNPRFSEFRPGIVKNNTPEAVGRAFELAKAYADSHTDRPPLITINSWNEWTETSYLEPDDLYGYGYLEAIRKVFGK